jgi:hypothetical protein
MKSPDPIPSSFNAAQHNPSFTLVPLYAPLCPAQPTPPPEPKIPVEGVVCLPVTKGVKCLRGVCNERLKLEVEYSLKKGTSENSYLLSVSDVTPAAAAAAARGQH